MNWIMDASTGERLDVDSYKARNQTIRIILATRKGDRIGRPGYGTYFHFFSNVNIGDNEIEYITNVSKSKIGDEVLGVNVANIAVVPGEKPYIGFVVVVDLENRESHKVEFTPSSDDN